jgi:hypothetical protein
MSERWRPSVHLKIPSIRPEKETRIAKDVVGVSHAHADIELPLISICTRRARLFFARGLVTLLAADSLTAQFHSARGQRLNFLRVLFVLSSNDLMDTSLADIDSKDTRYMRLALMRQSKRRQRWSVGAVSRFENEIIGRGFNQREGGAPSTQSSGH